VRTLPLYGLRFCVFSSIISSLVGSLKPWMTILTAYRLEAATISCCPPHFLSSLISMQYVLKSRSSSMNGANVSCRFFM
jgi:hypothetical protein